VDRLTPMTPAISSSVCCWPSLRRRAVPSLADVIRAGLPPTLPLARAAATPARERSIMTSRSNCASAEKTWKTRRPPGVVVSIPSCNERKPTPRSPSSPTTSIRCRTERPRRSKRQTTMVSPGRKWSNSWTSSGRSVRDPEAVSDHTRWQPAAFKASSCKSSRWSPVDTLAYPSRSPTRPTVPKPLPR
jgi:hypothetical protein